jgi:large subunit ribosomal protein L29
MKGRKPEDLRKLSDEDLAMQLRDAEETMTNRRFQKALSELEDTASLRTLRKDIARIKTIIRERELAVKG